MASQTDICNMALQILGAARINAITDQSVGARACLVWYDTVRQAVLRSHRWNFAIHRFSLPASATPPAFGLGNAYPLPIGFLKLLPPDPIFNYNDRDWIIENGSILTNFQPPLNIRCVVDVTDTTKMDPNFVQAFSARMAYFMCEVLTQSNTKKADAASAYKEAIAEAKKSNAIDDVPEVAAEDTWITARYNGTGSRWWPA